MAERESLSGASLKFIVLFFTGNVVKGWNALPRVVRRISRSRPRYKHGDNHLEVGSARWGSTVFGHPLLCCSWTTPWIVCAFAGQLYAASASWVLYKQPIPYSTAYGRPLSLFCRMDNLLHIPNG